MTMTWWLYVGAFIASVAIMIMGMVQGNFVFTGVGVLIGVALYFNRGRLQ